MIPAAQVQATATSKTAPWGQITARLLSLEGLLVAVCFTPAFQDP
jgi:hypothetical protein